MLRKLFSGILFLLLMVVLGLTVYVAWEYTQHGRIPVALPGLTMTPGPTPTPTPTPQMGPVVVAVRDLPAGALLSPAVVDVVQRPLKQIPPGAAVDLTQVVGQLVRLPYRRGEAIHLSDLAPRGQPLGEGSALAAQIPEGQVAVALPITRGQAPALRPGDRIDLLVTFLFVDVDPDFYTRLPDSTLVLSQNLETGAFAFRPAGLVGHTITEASLIVPVYVVPAEGQRPRLVVQMSLRGAKILALRNLTAPAATAEATPAGSVVLVLALPPQEAVTLEYLLSRQQPLTVLLRSPAETTATPPATVIPVSLQYIQEHFGVPLPPKQKYDVQPAGGASTPQP